MKAFLQRWYVVNQLYHYLHKRGYEFDTEDAGDFTRWVVGEDLKQVPNHWYNYIPPKGRLRMICHRFFWWFFLRNPIDDRLRKGAPLDYRVGKLRETIKKIIRECAKPGNSLISGVKNLPALELDHQKIGLTERGRDQYAFSYLLFRNDYSKKIWTGIIAGIVVWYATDRINNIVPPKIEINYVPQEVSQPTP